MKSTGGKVREEYQAKFPAYSIRKNTNTTTSIMEISVADADSGEIKLNDRETIIRILTKAEIPFEEYMSGEEGTENDIIAKGFGADDERIYFDFDAEESLANIVVYYV